MPSSPPFLTWPKLPTVALCLLSSPRGRSDPSSTRLPSSYLPTGLTSRLVSLVTGQSGSGANITTELVSSPETVIAALVMARQELAKVTALDVDLLDQYGDRLWIYWTEKDGDGWVTEEAIQEIEACLEKKWGEAGRKRRARCREGMPHAFVLDEGQSPSPCPCIRVLLGASAPHSSFR